MRFGVVVVLFDPNEENINNLAQFTTLGVKVCAVDNSAYGNVIPENYHYIHNNNQGGIAGAFNKGITYLLQNGCDFIFTFDQDSVLPHNFFDSMRDFISKNIAKMVVPDFIDTNSRTHASFINLDKWSYKVTRTDKNTAFAISSGMGFDTSVWALIGPFTEDYIIDHVDTEICLKALRNNISIFVNYDICLEHQIGNRSVHKFLGVTFKPNHHNYKRKYYIVRNGTHLSLKYLIDYPSYFFMNFLRIVHELLCVVLYEKDKLRKLRYMLKGLFHAICGKLGAVS